jgi:hypothetical protein
MITTGCASALTFSTVNRLRPRHLAPRQWILARITARNAQHSPLTAAAKPTKLVLITNFRFRFNTARADAWRYCDEAMLAIQTTEEKWCEAEVNRIAGEIALKSPEPDAAKAEGYFESALSVALAQQAKSWELRAATSLARLWRDQGKVQQARELLAPVYGWFTDWTGS